MNIDKILEANEGAIDKWVHPPKFSNSMNLVDLIKLLHDTKRYFIIGELKKLLKDREALRILDFGSGHGGITLDVKSYFGNCVRITGYDVSPKATNIARREAKTRRADVNFITDEACNLIKAVDGSFDAVISCDVFGHVPSVPVTFEEIRKILKPGGRLIAFSETITGESLTIPRFLVSKGFRMDDSEEEHISLHSVHELKSFLESSQFNDIKIYPYDPIRFPFHPKRYIRKLLKCNLPLFALSILLLLFQNRITEIFYNQFNLFYARHISLRDTAGCLISASA